MTPWIIAHQGPLSMRLSRQEYWSGLPFPSPGDLPDSRIEPISVSPALKSGFFTIEPPGKPICESSKLKSEKKFLYTNFIQTHQVGCLLLAKILKGTDSGVSEIFHLNVF